MKRKQLILQKKHDTLLTANKETIKMKFLIKITFNIIINQEYQYVEHFCSSYEDIDDKLTLFDGNKDLLCVFNKSAVLKYEVETIEEEPQTIIKSTKRKSKLST